MKRAALWITAVVGPAILETMLLAVDFDGALFLTAYVTGVIVVAAALYWYGRRSRVIVRPAFLTATFVVCAVATLFVSFLLLLSIMRGHN